MFFDKKRNLGDAILSGHMDEGGNVTEKYEDEGKQFLKGIAEELISHVKNGDADGVTSCLEALIAHIQAEDARQDQSSAIGGEGNY